MRGYSNRFEIFNEEKTPYNNGYNPPGGGKVQLSLLKAKISYFLSISYHEITVFQPANPPTACAEGVQADLPAGLYVVGAGRNHNQTILKVQINDRFHLSLLFENVF